jgi:hypothetical protein
VERVHGWLTTDAEAAARALVGGGAARDRTRYRVLAELKRRREKERAATKPGEAVTSPQCLREPTRPAQRLARGFEPTCSRALVEGADIGSNGSGAAIEPLPESVEGAA